MSAARPRDSSLPARDRYAAFLLNSRKSRLPPGVSDPQPPSAWPEENVVLLERYLAWLVADGAGHTCIDLYYLPVAGHVLGLNLKPHPQLDLVRDLERVMAYAAAKQLSERVTAMYRAALNRFRRFLRLERGMVEVSLNPTPPDISRYQDGLPDWLVVELTHYQRVRQVNWRPARLKQAIIAFWSKHTRLFLWLFSRYPVAALTDLRREQLFAYIDERLAGGYSAKSVNQDLRAFQAVLRFLQGRGFPVSQVLLHLPGLKEADALPRFLTDEQVNKLRAYFERQVEVASTPVQERNALLDRAAFYLLWHGGLRLGELEELCLGDLNIAQRQLMVRQGKGRKDRAVYLTDGAVAALTAYLAVQGSGQTDHVFLFRHRPLCKDFVRGRIKAAGERVGVKVTPHQLRHTYATQLLNAGCRITTLQALLGHERLQTTLTYARVHDRTVADDYYKAMQRIERRIEPAMTTSSEQGDQDYCDNLRAGKNGTNHQNLLALVDALENGCSGIGPGIVVNELRNGIRSLMEQLKTA
jgi:site-specific recombinase XerD